MSLTPYNFGAKGDGLTDDTSALGRWVAAGGGTIPAGNFRFFGPLRFDAGFKIERWEGKLLYARGWSSGYALCSREWSKTTSGVRIDASAGGELIYYGESDLPRKGIGLTSMSEFELVNPSVLGGAGGKGINLFSAEVRNSRNGRITGGRLSVLSGQQGADGIHFTQSCSDIELVSVRTNSGDDSVGLTVERSQHANSTMERITFTRCELENEGHSSLKMLLAAVGGGSVIRGVRLVDCTMRTRLTLHGAGLPVALWNRARAGGAVVENIVIEGGSTQVVVQEGGLIGLAAFQLESIDGMKIIRHDVFHFSRMAITATDCRDLVVEGGRVEPLKPVPPRPGVPLYRLQNCPNASIDLSGKTPSWPEQALMGPGG